MIARPAREDYLFFQPVSYDDQVGLIDVPREKPPSLSAHTSRKDSNYHSSFTLDRQEAGWDTRATSGVTTDHPIRQGSEPLLHQVWTR